MQILKINIGNILLNKIKEMICQGKKQTISFFESMLKLWGGVELWYIYYITLVTLCEYILQKQIRSIFRLCGCNTSWLYLLFLLVAKRWRCHQSIIRWQLNLSKYSRRTLRLPPVLHFWTSGTALMHKWYFHLLFWISSVFFHFFL